MARSSQIPSDIASKIKEGAQRRNEEAQRMRRLKQEQLEEEKERDSELEMQAKSGYIPYIFVSLLFLSFPLSEPSVDWILVSCFVVVNGVWTCFFRSYSWFNWIALLFSNFTLVRVSPIIPELPQLIQKLNVQVVAWYIVLNLAAAIILYYGFVERRLPFYEKEGCENKKSKVLEKNSSKPAKRESLEEFAKRKTRMDRLDWAASGLLLANIGALIYLGAIPYTVLLNGLRQLIALMR